MEKKQLISVVKPLIAAALLFGSSGGVAWGQTQMDCKNNFGAGESRESSRGTSALTADNDGALVPVSITLGGVNNVVGQIWVGSGYAYSTPPPLPTCGVVFYANPYQCTNYCGTHIGSNYYAQSAYSGCDNTFFGIYNGNLTCGNTATNAYHRGEVRQLSFE